MAHSPIASGMLGHGVNCVLDALDDPSPTRAVLGDELGTGLGGSTRISICRSAAELAASLQRQGEGSLSGLGWLPLLGGRLSFYRSLQTTIFSLSVVVRAWRSTSATRLSNPRLAPDVAAPQGEQDWRTFVRRHGDSYIDAQAMGGECVGVFTFRCENREQSEKVEQALRLGGLVSGVQLGANLHRSLENASRSSTIRYDFHYEVWGCSEIPALTPDTLVSYAMGFHAGLIDQPILLDLSCKGYETLPDMAPSFQAVAANRQLFTGNHGLLRQEQRLREILNQCRWVEDTLAVYAQPADPSLIEGMERLRADLAEIAALRERYRQDPAAPLAAPTLEAVAVGSPRLQVQIRDGERMGGGGGEPFRYPDREHAVQRRRRLARVGLRSLARIDQIRLRYQQEPTGADDEWIDAVHGGEGGRDLGDIELPTGVTVARLEALSGVPNGRVDRLRLTFSDGQSIGGGGDKGNTPLDWRPAPNQVLLGFNGRGKAELDALQAVIATFGPLAWEPLREEEDG